MSSSDFKDDDIEEELPPEPKSYRDIPLTLDEEEAKNIYQTAMNLLNKTKPNKVEAYELLQEAASRGYVDAKSLVAWAMLFGNPLQQNIDEAKNIFDSLADIGHPDGHMALGNL